MSKEIADLFKALSDATRVQIFHSLAIVSTAISISQISTDFNMSRQGVTKHIKILEQANLIEITVKGRVHYCKAEPKRLNEIKNWLNYYDQFWDNSLSNLSDYLG